MPTSITARDLPDDERPVAVQQEGAASDRDGEGRQFLGDAEPELPPEVEVAPELHHADVLETADQRPQRQHADNFVTRGSSK